MQNVDSLRRGARRIGTHRVCRSSYTYLYSMRSAHRRVRGKRHFRLTNVAEPTEPERVRRSVLATSCARSGDQSLTEHVRALTRPLSGTAACEHNRFWQE